MTKIFADSNFLIALFNSQDTLHNQAIAKSIEIETSRTDIVISNFVFSEVVTVLSQRVGRTDAVKDGEDILKGQATIIFVDEGLQRLSWEIFKEVKKKNMSFVDCSILAVMQSEGIKKLLSFDEEDFSSLRKAYDFSYY